jgi:hypothetical protein
MSKRSTKKKLKKNLGSSNPYIQTRSRMRILRMKGGNPRSVSEGGDLNTLIDSNHFPIIPLSEAGVSPLPAGAGTRDLLFGGRGLARGRGGLMSRQRTGRKTTVKKIRFFKNRKHRGSRNGKHRGSKNGKTRFIKGGGGAPFFLPDDLTNLKDSLQGGLVGAVNGYKGIDTPYQTNHTYPYQQSPYRETYNSSITDANAMYNYADNSILSKY